MSSNNFLINPPAPWSNLHVNSLSAVSLSSSGPQLYRRTSIETTVSTPYNPTAALLLVSSFNNFDVANQVFNLPTAASVYAYLASIGAPLDFGLSFLLIITNQAATPMTVNRNGDTNWQFITSDATGSGTDFTTIAAHSAKNYTLILGNPTDILITGG